MTTSTLSQLDLELDVFQGPFDLLLTLILNEELDLLDVDLAEIVLAYLKYLDQTDQLDLEAATEFLVLIAALLELKSKLLLPHDEEQGLDITPAEAAEELIARMLEYRRFSKAAEWIVSRYRENKGFNYRHAPLPSDLRKVSLEAATKSYEPALLSQAVTNLLTPPPKLSLTHMGQRVVSLEHCLENLRQLVAGRGRFTFDQAVGDSDRVTEAVTLFALLELYRKGELSWEQKEMFGEIEITAKGDKDVILRSHSDEGSQNSTSSEAHS